MNLADIRAEIEAELTWRIEEMNFLKNLIPAEGEQDQDRYRKSLVVMLYSHFEGFWKAAFSIYVRSINQIGVKCGEAQDCLVASSLHDVLKALVDPERQSDFFRRDAPEDRKLHTLARQAEFLGRTHDITPIVVTLDSEQIVNTESNLSPAVVRKNLFRLGFKPNHFEVYEGTVNRLLETRNSVAHGALREGVTAEQYESLDKAVRQVLESVVLMVFEALKDKKYLRSA